MSRKKNEDHILEVIQTLVGNEAKKGPVIDDDDTEKIKAQGKDMERKAAMCNDAVTPIEAWRC